MRLLIIENLISDLKKSRYPLGEYFESNGIKVFYACPNQRSEEGIFHLPLKRDSLSPKNLIQTVLVLTKIEQQCRVDTVLSFRLVPNVINYFSSFLSKRKRFVVITGLGFLFISDRVTLRHQVSRTIITRFYRIASKRVTVISQNIDDLLELGLAEPYRVVNGSGLKDDFISCRTTERQLNLLFVGRLLRSKGIIEAYELFLLLQKSNKNVKLTIAGERDNKNPDSITEYELADIVKTKNVEYLGYVADLKNVFLNSNVLIFPSKYREGVPRVIVEALKFGLTILTYNLPGCKETVTSNGLLLRPGHFLSDKVVEYLLNLNQEDIHQNSINSRKLFLEKFSSDVVYKKYYNIIIE